VQGELEKHSSNETEISYRNVVESSRKLIDYLIDSKPEAHADSFKEQIEEWMSNKES